MMLKFFKYLLVLMTLSWAAHLAGFAGPVMAASKGTLVEKGNTLFQNGDYDGALDAYEEAAVFDPESARILFNKGAALYKKEDYAAARDAFQQSALKTKDIAFEANARFNAGLCFFREGERQKDSDLNKTLEAYGASIQAFQEALKLNPDLTEAAENIELVRLMMKSVLDEIKKQEDAARKQQEAMRKTAEKIKALIDKQTDLVKESEQRTTAEDKSPAAQGHSDLADAQNQLKQETLDLSNELATPAPAAGSGNTGEPSVHPSKPYLDTSVEEQENAVTQLADNDIQNAADHQKGSLDALKKALEAMTESQNQKNGAQQGADSNGAAQNQPTGQEKQDSAPESRKEPEKTTEPTSGDQKEASDQVQSQDKEQDQKQNQGQAFELADDPDSILDEEKQNQKQRTPVSTGKFREVDKDW